MDVRAELEKAGCVYSGHFVGTSGRHLAGYWNIDPLLPHVKLVNELIKILVESFKDDNIETVASPAIGAIPFSHWGAHHLMAYTDKEIFGVWGDKVKNAETKSFAFERQGFSRVVKGKRILILEDVINQMFSIKAMIETVRKAGGEIVGVGSVAANKGVSAEAMDVPKFVQLCPIEYETWTPEDCIRNGLCSKNVPIVLDIGHGKEYQKENPDYPGGYISLLND